MWQDTNLIQQKSILSRYTNRKHTVKEIKKSTSFTVASEIKSSDKFKQELKTLTWKLSNTKERD